MIEFYRNGTTKLILTHYFLHCMFSIVIHILSSDLIATPNGQTVDLSAFAVNYLLNFSHMKSETQVLQMFCAFQLVHCRQIK